MTKAEAFLVQARSDFNVFQHLLAIEEIEVPDCHALQHLQMATEKLAKSIRLFLDPNDQRAEYSHVAFRELLVVLRRVDVARKLGYTKKLHLHKAFLDRRQSWFKEVEQLSRALEQRQRKVAKTVRM